MTFWSITVIDITYHHIVSWQRGTALRPRGAAAQAYARMLKERAALEAKLAAQPGAGSTS